MLAIRMQRTGRKGHAEFRIIVQDSRRTPTSGNIVAQIGHYNPHTKNTILDKEKASFYLDHGAQPSDSIARLLKNEGVKLPVWVKLAADKARPIRNLEKLRKNRPAEAEKPQAAEPEEVPTEAAIEPETAEVAPEAATASEPAEETVTADTTTPGETKAATSEDIEPAPEGPEEPTSKEPEADTSVDAKTAK